MEEPTAPSAATIKTFFDRIDVKALRSLEPTTSDTRRFRSLMTKLAAQVQERNYARFLRLLPVTQISLDLPGAVTTNLAFFDRLPDEIFYKIDLSYISRHWSHVPKFLDDVAGDLGHKDWNLDFTASLLQASHEFIDEEGDPKDEKDSEVLAGIHALAWWDQTVRVENDFLDEVKLELDQVKAWRSLCRIFDLKDESRPHLCGNCGEVHGYILQEDIRTAMAIMHTVATREIGQVLMKDHDVEEPEEPVLFPGRPKRIMES